MGLLMHPAVGSEDSTGTLTGQLLELYNKVNAVGTTVAEMYTFMCENGVAEPKFLDLWKTLPSFANFRTAFYKLTMIAQKEMDIATRIGKDTMVTVSFSFDLR